jgi:hypothetical protein
MPNATTRSDRDRIALQIFGKTDDFSAFFCLYDNLVMKQAAQAVQADHLNPESLRYHDGILRIIQLLRENVHDTRDGVLVRIKNNQSFVNSSFDHALNIAVQTMVMIDSAAQNWHPSNYKLGGYRPTSWDPTESFVNFVQRTFKMDMTMDESACRTALEDRHILKAWKLKKRLGINIRPTENLAEHLLFDARNNILYLFHHVAFLKAHLERWKTDLRWDCNLEDSLKV